MSGSGRSSFFRRTLPKVTFALVALTVGVLLSRADSALAVGTFNATTVVSLSSNGAGGNADMTFSLDIAAPDYIGGPINGIPKGSSANIACGPGYTGPAGDCAAGGPAKGDVVGKLHSATKLGLLNAPCSGDADVNFVFLNATVDVTDTIDPIPQSATNTGQGGTLSNQWSDNGSGTGQDPPWDSAWPNMDAGESGNGLPAQVDEYPSYLNTIFSPDEGLFPGVPVHPVARYAGAADVAGTVVTLNLVIFAPNALAAAFPSPHPFHDTKGMGYTSIAVLGNPVAEAAPGQITDFCTPLDTDTTAYGTGRANPCNGVTSPPCNTPAGISLPCSVFPTDSCTGLSTTTARWSNPSPAGTYAWVSLHQSVRDKDGDGKENTLDTCASDSDTLDQRTGAGPDSDADGIADVCDSVSNAGDNDQDDDGWMNRADNCPTFANPDNGELEDPPTLFSVAAPKGGPRTDGIGDACDANPTLADGDFLSTLTYQAKCIGGTDGDGDGYCSTDDPNDSNAGRMPETSSRHFIMWMVNWGSGDNPPEGQPVQLCNDGIDNDGDGATDTADSGCASVDIDGDGFSYAVEVHVGTDPLQPCDRVTLVPEPNLYWPSDFAGTSPPTGTSSANRVTLADVTSFAVPPPTRPLFSFPGDPNYNVRWDINPANPAINLADLTTLTAGPNGSPARPPMYDWLTVSPPNAAPKAFGNPVPCSDIFKP